MEEEPHRYEEATEDTDPDYTTPSGVGDDTIDGAAEDATTDGATEDATTDDGSTRTDGSQPKRQGKDRRPNVLGTVKEEFTEVSPQWASNGAQRISQWVRGTTRVHSPEHHLNQDREPKAS